MARKTLAEMREPIENDEGNATEQIMPGDAIVQTSSRDGYGRTDVALQSTAAAANDPFLLAFEEWNHTKTDPYASGESVPFVQVRPGQKVEVRVPGGTTIDPDAGDGSQKLVFDGTGKFRPLDTAGGDSAAAVVCTALEAITTAAGEPGRVLVRKV